MKNDSKILASVLVGYDKKSESPLWSSAVWMAEKAGATRPMKARIGRGYSVRVETAANEFVIKFSGNKLENVTMERV